MSELERRYRLLLRALPAWYRERRADEMVDAFLTGWLDEHQSEIDGDESVSTAWAYGWPGWAEIWSVAALAIRTRAAATVGPPRARATGHAVRLIALLGLLFQAALGVAGLTSALTSPLRSYFSHDVSVLVAEAGELAIVAAFALLLWERRAPARVAAALALVSSVIGMVRTTFVTAGHALPAVVLVSLPLWITVAALYAGFHADAPTPRARPWLWAMAAAIGVGLAWGLVVGRVSAGTWVAALIGDPGMLSAWAVIVAGLGYPVLIGRRGLDPSGTVATALAVVAAAALPARVDAADLFDAAARPLLTAEFVAMAATVVVLAVFGLRGVRRIPARDQSG